MKTVVHTLRYGQSDWLDACVPTLEAYCLRHGYPLAVWNDDYDFSIYPNAKFAAEHRMLEEFVRGDADRLIWMDADIRVHPEAPAFPSMPGLAMATDGMHADHQDTWMEWCHTEFDIDPRFHDYSNAGVFSIDRKAARQFLEFFKPPFIEHTMDQFDFNRAAYQARESGMEFTTLHSDWNRWGRDLNPAWLRHLWGDQKMRDLDTLREIGMLDVKPDGRTYCFMPPGFPVQDKVIVLQFVKDSGLGNRFFELAAGLHLGDRLKLPVLLSWLPTGKRDFGLEAFGIGILPFKEYPVVSQRLGQGNVDMVDRSATAIHESKERFPAVCHPFQSEECFPRAADKVRELFKLEPYPLEVPAGKTPVAVQVRRGDYVKHPRLSVTTPGYFLNGLDFIRRRVAHPHFYFVSDDPAWCREQFGHLADVTVMPPQSAIDGLRTMVACKSACISNSTFGWWGAWLANADPVVVPEKWATNMKFYGDWKPAPERWHRVSVERKVEQKPLVSLPPPPVDFREFPQQYPRAICIPYWHRGDKWHSLRFCLRSIDRYFEDKTCPIIIFGTARPPFLTFQKHRVIYIETWTYQEALMHAVQIAGETVFMNDDQAFLQPCGWEDLRRPYHYGPIPETLLEEFRKNPNPWRKEVLKAVDLLGPELLNFSVHLPYLYEREKGVEIFREFKIAHKMPFELYHGHRYGVAPRLLNGEKAMSADFKDAKFLNYTDKLLTPELKVAISARLPDFAKWEGRIPITI